MRTIELTQGYVASVDDADFDRVSAHRWCANKNRHTVYAYRKDGRRTVYMHRFICGVTDPEVKVDHRNRNGLDNQRRNLRDCSNGQNSMNQRKRRDGVSSKFKGVCWHKRDRKFQADIRLNGRSKFLGMFVSELDAALAYDTAAREHFGEFALCNFPPKKPCVNSSPALHSAHGVTSAQVL